MRLLITGAWNANETDLQRIRDMGHTVIYMQNERDDLPCPYEAVEGVICNGLFLYHPMDRFPSLRYIQLTSAGVERVDMAYAQEHKILVHNANGVYSIPMAEFAIAAVLRFYKRFAFFENNQQNRLWEKDRTLCELYGKTVCIVGCGSVGVECAKRFCALGCHVVGVNRSLVQNECFEHMFPMDDLLCAVSCADIVVLSVALTEQTYHLIDEAVFAAMKQGSVLINVSRGGILDMEALLPFLQKEKICAALDVFEEEPLSADDPLWALENVFVTPHNSFVGDGNRKRLRDLIYKNLELMV